MKRRARKRSPLEVSEMVVTVLMIVAGLCAVGAWLVCSKAGEKEGICQYDYVEKEDSEDGIHS